MELTSPITIYWDLPAGTADTSRLLRICADIIACRPLMLHLRDAGAKFGRSTHALLDMLKEAPIAVYLTIPPVIFKEAGGQLLHEQGLKEILLAVESVAELTDVTGVMRLHSPQEGRAPGAPGPVMGISFTVTAANWRELPGLVTLCREKGINRLVLPMQRLYDGEIPFSLNLEEQRTLAGSLAFIGGTTGMELTIHDPFLWRAFNPGVPFPQGGCQAANTMIAIAPDGGVYPCPALPVLLGRIGAASLKEIVASSAKKEFRRGLLEYPTECRGCGELAECRGGCRGRACAVHGSLDGADPACGRK